MIIAAFVSFILFFLIVGAFAAFKQKGDPSDYLLAGRNVPAWLTALSAVATCYSGYMFIGLIGLTYLTGLSAIWLQVGYIAGDFCMTHLVHPRLRDNAQKRQILSFPEALARWNGREMRLVRLAAALLTIIVLGVYAAAQLKAGGKALVVLFGWPESTGAIMGAVLILAYCFRGGLRASIWTDAVQSIIMFTAMGALFLVAIAEAGGIAAFIRSVINVAPGYASLMPPQDLLGGPALGFALFLLGWVFTGVGVTGQPHIMIRFMAMNKSASFTAFRAYYFTWSIIFTILTIGCGLAARVFLPFDAGFDAELALPSLSLNLLPGILTGFILAGLFSSTLSTADSQILACSAAFSHDLTPHNKRTIRQARLGTFFMLVLALVIALYAPGTVFSLILDSWAAAAAAFSPLVLVYALGARVSEKQALAMMTAGLAVMLYWTRSDYGAAVYSALPGVMTGLAVWALWEGARYFRRKQTLAETSQG